MGYPEFIEHRYVLTASDRWHRIVIDTDGERWSPERCNLDDAEIITTTAEIPPSDAERCDRCYHVS